MAERRAEQAEQQIHVRGIGIDGWDGTEGGVGRYENEAALQEIFGAFGTFVQATIRHRIEDGQNTSWALVTMGDAESVDRALAAPSVMAGTGKLVLNRYSKKQAAASTGAMVRVQHHAAVDELRLNACHRARVIAGQHMLAAHKAVHRLGRMAPAEIVRRTDAARAAAHDRNGARRLERFLLREQRCLNVAEAPEGRLLAPEAVGAAGCDEQSIVGLLMLSAIGSLHHDRLALGVELRARRTYTKYPRL